MGVGFVFAIYLYTLRIIPPVSLYDPLAVPIDVYIIVLLLLYARKVRRDERDVSKVQD